MPENPPQEPAAAPPIALAEEPAATPSIAPPEEPAAPEPAAPEPAAPEPARPWITLALLAANTAVWILTVALGASVGSPSPQRMFELGGNLGVATLDGEQWRLFTSMFLHFGVLHLAMNMYGLYSGGRFVERLYGWPGFAAIYLISGLAGSLASALRPDEGVVSAGASAAIFGVLGAAGAFYLVHRDRMEQALAKQASGLLVFVALNLVLGFTQKGIDMYAHLGGLAAGFLCGFAIEAGRRGPRRPRTALVAAIGLAAVIAAAFLAPAPGAAERRAVQAFVEAEQKALARWNELAASSMTLGQAADVIEREILPAWHEARNAIERSQAGGEHRSALLDYLRMRQEAWELIVKGARTEDEAAVKRGQELFDKSEEIVTRLRQ